MRMRAMTFGLVLVAGSFASAQRQPGYVDPEPVLKAAAAAVGVDQVS